MLSHVDSTSDSESSRSAATGATGTVRSTTVEFAQIHHELAARMYYV